MTKVRNDNYIIIQGWMVSELNLKGNELLIYAIIYGFTQDGSQKFTGSLQYLADWTNASKQTVIATLKSLVEKKLIGKEDTVVGGVKFVKYWSNFLNGGSQISLMGYSKNLNGGSQISLPNNIYNNIYNNINNNKEVERKSPLDLSFVSPEFEKIVNEWIEYKKERKDSYTQTGIKKFYKNLLEYSQNTPSIAQQIIDKSISCNYKGIFPLQGNQTKTPSRQVKPFEDW